MFKIFSINKSKVRALTLAEVMIAAAVLILVCSMLYLLFVNCIILNQLNRERTIAMSHAEYIMEEIRNESFTGLHAKIMTSNFWDWDEADITAAELQALTGESINVTSDDSVADLLDVSVTVSWTNRRSETGQETLRTYIVYW